MTLCGTVIGRPLPRRCAPSTRRHQLLFPQQKRRLPPQTGVHRRDGWSHLPPKGGSGWAPTGAGPTQRWIPPSRRLLFLFFLIFFFRACSRLLPLLHPFLRVRPLVTKRVRTKNKTRSIVCFVCFVESKTKIASAINSRKKHLRVLVYTMSNCKSRNNQATAPFTSRVTRGLAGTVRTPRRIHTNHRVKDTTSIKHHVH